MKLPSFPADWHISAKCCSPWFQVRWLFHSHHTVFVKCVWFQFGQNARPKLQNLLLGLASSQRHQIPAWTWYLFFNTGSNQRFSGTERVPGRRANKPCPASFCQRRQKPAHPWEPRLHPERTGAGAAHEVLTWPCCAEDKAHQVHPQGTEYLSLRALRHRPGLSFQSELCDSLQVPTLWALAEEFGKKNTDVSFHVLISKSWSLSLIANDFH